MLFAPLNSSLETFVILVRTFDKDIEVNLLYYFIYSAIDHNVINIANSLHHVATLLGGVKHLGFWLVFEDDLAVLNCHYKMVAQGLCATKHFYVTYVEKVIDSYCQYLFHSF